MNLKVEKNGNVWRVKHGRFVLARVTFETHPFHPEVAKSLGEDTCTWARVQIQNLRPKKVPFPESDDDWCEKTAAWIYQDEKHWGDKGWHPHAAQGLKKPRLGFYKMVRSPSDEDAEQGVALALRFIDLYKRFFPVLN